MRLASRSLATPALEGLIDFLVFVVQKLWQNKQKLIKEIPTDPV